MAATPRGAVLAVLGWAVLASWAVAEDAEAVRRELGQGLKTVWVVSVRVNEKAVGHLPARAAVVDEGGSPAKLAVQPLGEGQVFVSGHLALTADPQELAELRRRSRVALGEGAKVTEVRADTFACWLKVGDAVVWQRPVADGPLGPVPFQAMAPAAKQATLVIAATWTERWPGVAAKFEIDWDEVRAGLAKAAGANGRLTETKLLELSATAMAARWVEVRPSGAPADGEGLLKTVRGVFLDELKRRLLDLDEPQPAPASDGKGKPTPDALLSYRVRTDLRRATGKETLDLSVARDVRHTALVSSLVALDK